MMHLLEASGIKKWEHAVRLLENGALEWIQINLLCFKYLHSRQMEKMAIFDIHYVAL